MTARTLETERDAPLKKEASLLLEDIRFANQDLSRPLYPTLINYPQKLADQVQVDLGIQVGRHLDHLEITFTLRNAGVSFVPEGLPETVKCRALNDPTNPPAEVEALFGKDERQCIFHWRRVVEKPGVPLPLRVKAYRIFCQEDSSEPSAQEIVYGGIFVAIIDFPRLGGLGFHTMRAAAPVESLAKLELVGIDDMGRPLYNIFKSYDHLVSKRADIEIEPTYRVCERQEFRFDFDLVIPEWTFTRELKFLEPPNVRSAFAYTSRGRSSSRFSWTRRDSGLESPDVGSASSFHLGVSPLEIPEEVFSYLAQELRFVMPKTPEKLKELIFRHLETIVDPTIIEPPRCAGGICVG